VDRDPLNPYAPPVTTEEDYPDPFAGSAPGDEAFHAPHRGGLVLGLGIAGLALMSACGLGFVLGLPAWIMGARDQRKMDTGRMDPGGHGLTRAGKICGAIATILGLLILLIYGVAILVGISEGSSSSPGY
jgi:hypothetical protein